MIKPVDKRTADPPVMFNMGCILGIQSRKHLGPLNKSS